MTKAANSTAAGEDLREQIVRLREDLENLGAATRNVARAKVQESKDAASDVIDRGRERAGELEEELLRRIRSRPLTSLLVAGGVGVLAGLFWRR